MIKQIIKQIIIWRLGLLIVTLIAIQFIPFRPTFPYAAELLEPQGHPLFWSLANFDGVHYIGIADKGYFAQFTQAFFPFYPLLTRWLNVIFNNYILSGYFISHVSLVAFFYLFNQLLKLDYSSKTTNNALLLYLIFPTSFFFAALYTESLFMVLVIGSFLAARKKHWLLAGILGGVASATRLFGILLLPALIVELWQQSNSKKLTTFIKTSWQKLISVSISASGLLLYMAYLAKNFSDALYFLHAQPVFGASRSADKLILLYQVFWRYTKMIFTVDPQSILYYTVSQEFILSLLFLVLAIIAFKKTRLSYAVFGILAFFLPTLTGTLSSVPRYALTVFPAFIVLGQIKSKPLKNLIFVASSLLLIINISLFTRGYWVS